MVSSWPESLPTIPAFVCYLHPVKRFLWHGESCARDIAFRNMRRSFSGMEYPHSSYLGMYIWAYDTTCSKQTYLVTLRVERKARIMHPILSSGETNHLIVPVATRVGTLRCYLLCSRGRGNHRASTIDNLDILPAANTQPRNSTIIEPSRASEAANESVVTVHLDRVSTRRQYDSIIDHILTLLVVLDRRRTAGARQQRAVPQ